MRRPEGGPALDIPSPLSTSSLSSVSSCSSSHHFFQPWHDLQPPPEDPMASALPSHMAGYLHPLGGPSTGVYSYVSKPSSVWPSRLHRVTITAVTSLQEQGTLGRIRQKGGQRLQLLNGGPTPTDTIFLRRRENKGGGGGREREGRREDISLSLTRTTEKRVWGKLREKKERKQKVEKEQEKGGTEKEKEPKENNTESKMQEAESKDTGGREAWTQTEVVQLQDRATQMLQQSTAPLLDSKDERVLLAMIRQTMENSLREVMEEEEGNREREKGAVIW